jgi:methionyl-tRNA formyltransferase
VENTVGASSIFLSEEIDSGPILMRQKFPAPADRQEIDHVYDSAARAKILVETLRRYIAIGEWDFDLPENLGGETYYIIHPVLKHIGILSNGDVNK